MVSLILSCADCYSVCFSISVCMSVLLLCVRLLLASSTPSADPAGSACSAWRRGRPVLRRDIERSSPMKVEGPGWGKI